MRRGQRFDTADRGCARRKWRGGNEELISLGRCRPAGHALTRESVDVRVRRCETIRERLQEGDDLVLLLIGQTEAAGCHVDVVRNLGHRPAIHFFRFSFRTVPRRDLERKHIAGIVEMDELLEALDVAIVEELFLEIGSGRLRRGALWRRHRDIARRRSLHLAVAGWGKLYPLRVGIGGASEKGPQSQVSVTEAVGIGREPEAVRCGLVKQRDPGIERQAKIGIAQSR
jgi:hypothetical protein